MPVLYTLTLPERGIIDVRRAADRLDAAELRGAGLHEARVHFAGSRLLLFLDGGTDDALERFRATRTGASFLDHLEEQAWFGKRAQRLEPAFEAGEPRGHGALTGALALPVNPGRAAVLGRELREVAPAEGPRVAAFLAEGLLVLRFAFGDVAEVDDVLHGVAGGELQRVLEDHTGFSRLAWREEFALDQEGVKRGLLSGAGSSWAEGPVGQIPNVPGETEPPFRRSG